MRILKIITLFVTLFLLYSCSEVQAQSAQIVFRRYAINLSIESSNYSKRLPKGLKAGRVRPFKANDKVEQNMLRQFATYNAALLIGDFDNAMRYVYNDAAKYFKKYYPSLNDYEIKRGFFESSNETIEIYKKYQEYGIELNSVVGRLLRKIKQGDKIVFVFEMYMNLIYEDNRSVYYSTPEIVVGISENLGRNWSFITMNEDTPNILRLSFTNEFVDKVMDY